MVRIYVIRHGETEPNTRRACVGRGDYPLNKTGKMQAQKLAEKLSVKTDVIYVSPLCRAYQTIEPYLLKHPDTEVHTVPEIIERDFGIWENLSFKEIEKIEPIRYKEWQDNYIEYKIPEGESLLEVACRINSFIEKVCPLHDGQTIFMVTHLCTARQIIATLLGLDPYKSRCFTMENASYAVIDYNIKSKCGVLNCSNI